MLCYQEVRIILTVDRDGLLCEWRHFFTFLNWFWATLRLFVIVFKQFRSMFTGRFIVSMIYFILSYFDILPCLSDFINFHRDTSRIALASVGDQGSRFSILFSDASAARVPVVMRLSSSSIYGMSLMVSVLFFIHSLILSVCAIMLWCLTNAYRCYLYFVTRLISFDWRSLLEASIMF